MTSLKNFIPSQTINRIIVALTVWQFISVALMSVGTWPGSVALLNTVLLGLFVLIAKPYYSVLLLILSIPFYVVLPNPVVQNLPMWRVLFALLFVVWFIRLLIAQRQFLLKFFSIQRWSKESPITGARLREIIRIAIDRVNSRFMPWDKVAVLFLVIALASLLIARFPLHGFKQILFLLNVYIFYIVTVNVVTDEGKLQELIRYTIYSLGIMVALGFAQYFATLFSMPYYFWQYWATMVSSLYYGNPLGNVLAYSNSWFSYSGGTQVLRMFGILPDTHAFGVICIFLLAYLLPHLKVQTQSIWDTVKLNKWYLLAAIVLAAFGVMANGTRGVWVAMLAPIAVALIAFSKKFFKPFFKLSLAAYGVVVVLFLLSPLISQGMNYIRTIDIDDNFLDRASSIYDLQESSNVGRLEIWKNSLQFAATHPFGVGYGNFITSLAMDIPEGASFEDVSSVKNLRYNLPQQFITAHSLYLQLMVELGFAGLLAFILFWWEYFQKLWEFLRKRAGVLNRYTTLTISIGLALIWLLAYGVFDVTILNDRVLMYLFISLGINGLIFARYESFNPPEQEQ